MVNRIQFYCRFAVKFNLRRYTEVIMYHVAQREVYTSGMFYGQKIPTMHTAVRPAAFNAQTLSHHI
jgi:hypothetical protein